MTTKMTPAAPLRRLTDRELRRLLTFAREDWSEDDLARLAIEELAELRAALTGAPTDASTKENGRG